MKRYLRNKNYTKRKSGQRLNQEMVDAVKVLVNAGMSLSQAGAQFNIAPSTMSDLRKHNWNHEAYKADILEKTRCFKARAKNGKPRIKAEKRHPASDKNELISELKKINENLSLLIQAWQSRPESEKKEKKGFFK